MKTISKSELIKEGIVTKEQLEIETFKDLVDKITKNIPAEIARKIIEEARDKKYEIGISKEAIDDTQNVFKNGLELNGGRDLGYGITFADDSLLLMMSQCLHEYRNKNANNIYIVKLPKNVLKYEQGESIPILFPTDEINENGHQKNMLLSEYILGCFKIEKGKFSKIVDNEKYKEEHEYMPDGLTYADRAIITYCEKENIEIPKKEEEIQIIEDTISEEYKQKHPLRENAYVANVKAKANNEIFTRKEQKIIEAPNIIEKIRNFFRRMKKQKSTKYLQEGQGK